MFADVLDFENTGLQDGDFLPQSFGDTSEVDVQYGISGGGQPINGSLVFRESVFPGPLENFVSAAIFDGGLNFRGGVVLSGLGGNLVTLESFEVAGIAPFNDVVFPIPGFFTVVDGGECAFRRIEF